MSWRTYKFGDFLHRSKIPIDIEDGQQYKRVTIKTKHQGVSVRDTEKGKKIGTKKQFVLKAGQFVLSKIDARYGAFGIAPDEVEGAIITGNFWAYDVDFSIINIEWFNQFTNSQDFYDVCERASSGITHRKYLNEDFFLNYEIELPDVEEQLRIVEEFKTNKITLETQSSELTHQLDLVKQLRQAFLREAMQGKLVPQNETDEPASVLLEKIKAEKERLIKEKKIKKQKPLPPITEEEIPFEIPESWEWHKFGNIAEMSRGRFSARPRNDPQFYKGEYPFLQIGSLDDCGSVIFDAPQSLNEKGLKVSKQFPKNTVVIAIVGGTIANLGVLGKEMCFPDSLIGFYPFEKMYNQDYLLYFLRFSQPILRKAAYQMSGQPNIKLPNLQELAFPMPPLSEQHRIVTKLDGLMAYCDKLEASIKESQQQNELLLQQVLREALEPA
jgi:type I restriction enzyme S subunit